MSVRDTIARLRKTDILFGSVTTNVILILINLIQVFGTIVFVSFYEKSKFDSSTVWWILMDSTRVLCSTIIRIESLLKEQEDERIFIRNFIFTTNVFGLIFSLLVSVYIITLMNSANNNTFVFELLAGLIVGTHVLTTIPALITLCRQPVTEQEALLDNNYEQIGDEEDPDLPAEESPPAYYPPQDINPAADPQYNDAMSAEIEQQALLWQLAQQEHQQRMSQRQERAIQDLEYESLLHDHSGPSSVPTLGSSPSNDLSEPTMAEIIPEPEPQISPAVKDTKQLSAPPPPPEKSPDTVMVRVRLTNGSTVKRRFLKTQSVAEVHNFVDYQLSQAGITLSNVYQLVMNHPRTKYDDLNASLESVELYISRSGNRECVTPVLFCEELI